MDKWFLSVLIILVPVVLSKARQNNIATFVVDYKSIIREFKKDPQKGSASG